MERDFRYLRDKYGEAGAREIFEKICSQLLYAINGEKSHHIQISQGDDGIDILVGDFSRPIENYQCKYFIDGIGDSQKQQIRESFQRAINSQNYKMDKWILCIPTCMNAKEFKWWSTWKEREKKITGIDITLFDGGYLITQLKKYDIYEKTFDDDVRQNLQEILNSLNAEKKRITEEIIVLLKESESVYNDMLFVKKLEMANITLVDMCKQHYFNAEYVEYVIRSKGDAEKIKLLENLKKKVLSFWETQYLRYQNDFDGNELLSRTYERIEDADTQALSCSALPEISILAKKGMLHQWAEECSVGWLKDYKEKIKTIFAMEE